MARWLTRYIVENKEAWEDRMMLQLERKMLEEEKLKEWTRMSEEEKKERIKERILSEEEKKEVRKEKGKLQNMQRKLEKTNVLGFFN